ncbi:hypothetical protein L1887_09315 [Cichorium endivia]|nr:hypothetical protein L1887_09315 [Cichorium endivia]
MEEGRYDEYPSTKDSYYEDERMDTLSLSDLLIDTQDFYRVEDPNPNLDIDEEFEFSSELLKTSVAHSVVFCGKVIPYKESSVSQNTYKLERKKQQKHHKRKWRFFTFFNKPSKSKANLDSKKLDLKYEAPIRRVSILASATKPRWYLLMFGVGSSRFPAQMHIRDLKKRQTSMGTKAVKDNKISGSNNGGIGSWRLVRFLGCGGSKGGDSHHPNAIVKIE